MSQIQAPKVVSYAMIGPANDTASVPKVVAYMILVPGETAPGDLSGGQSHVHAQVIRRS